MRIDGYLEHIPEIERRLSVLRPDAIVIGLGPSAHLLPWIDQRLLLGVRRWGVNDVFRVLPVDDLLVLDAPNGELTPPIPELYPEHMQNRPEIGLRHKWIVTSRPQRLWIYEPHWQTKRQDNPLWDQFIPACLHGIVRPQPFKVFYPGDPTTQKSDFALVTDPPQTSCISPIGAITLAWKEGARRIGLIGADCMPGNHHSNKHSMLLNIMLKSFARQAQELGGQIAQLSPFSALSKLPAPCEPHISGSAPMIVNAALEPSGY